MIKDKHVAWMRRLLLAFVLVSVGFAFGRHSVTPTAAAARPPERGNDVVMVYYLHAAFRCVTCNTIEKMTRELLDGRFKKELSDGSMVFREVNFQADEAMAKQFGVVASCVVVAAVKDGRTVDFRRLDEVWTLMNDRNAFDRCVSDAIAAMRQKLNGGKP